MPHSGKFMYMPQYQRFSAGKLNKKKPELSSQQSSPFDEEPLEFNDLDSNMLNRNLIKFLPTDSLRLELLLERSEKKLKKIDEELKTAIMLEFNEFSEEDFLKKRKKELLKEINSFKSEYRELGLVYKIADIISDLKAKIKEIINIIKIFLCSIPIISVLLKKFPGYNEKIKLEKMNLLQKKLSGEFNKKSQTDNEKLEYLFMKFEEMGL